MVGEEGVCEVVGVPLRLISILSFLEGNSHYSSVVDEAAEFLCLALVVSFATETTDERFMWSRIRVEC